MTGPQPIGPIVERIMQRAMTGTPKNMQIQRVANGWLVRLGDGSAELTSIAATPHELADIVVDWATRTAMAEASE